MPGIGTFGDFMKATRPKLVTDTKYLRNESTKYRTYLIRTMLNGLGNKKAFQGGSELVDYIRLENTSSYMDYLPTDDFEWTGSNSLTELKMPWRFSLVYSTWYDHEVELNKGEDKETKFKNLRDVKLQEMMQSWWEGMEDALWATPDENEMESGNGSGAVTNGKKPYSLRAFLTDDGLAPSSTNGGVTGAGGDWSTVMTVNPTTKTNWKNQYETYTAASIATELIPKFDRMWLKVQFESPESAQQYAEDTRLNKMKILASMVGYTKLVELATARNDTLTPKNDLGYQNGNITYHGVPIKYIGALDTVDATPDAAVSPKYRWFNFNDIYPIFHKTRYMHPVDPPISAGQPFAHLMLRDTWRNIWCTSRRELGIVRAA